MIPHVLVHVRLSTTGAEVDALNPLKAAIVQAVAAHADTWGVRVKRRALDRHVFTELMAQYEVRAVVDTTAARRRKVRT